MNRRILLLGGVTEALAIARQLGPEHVHSDGLVLGLGSLVLTLDDDPRWFVGDPHGRVGLVDVLAAGPGCPVGVHPDFGIVDLDVDVLIDQWRDVELGKAGVTAR